ncbi:MAG: hypothetical protein FWD17_14070 [Polyangiaceae bacterium]|nr:hypothetical protein [Polyangiaceae bacterium]
MSILQYRVLAPLGLALLAGALDTGGCRHPPSVLSRLVEDVAAHSGDTRPLTRAPVLGKGRVPEGGYRMPLQRPVVAGARVVLLPPDRTDGEVFPLEDGGIAPGAHRGGAFPAGTVYVARNEHGRPWVSEWDLARGEVVRSVRLNLPGAAPRLRIRRIGEALHVLAQDRTGGPVQYVRLTLDLHDTTSHVIGHVSEDTDGTIVGDSEWVAAVYNGDVGTLGVEISPGMYIASFDSTGQRIATRLLRERMFDGGRPMAVFAGGYALVALDSPEPGWVDLLRIDRDLRVERVTHREGCRGIHEHVGETFEGLHRDRDALYLLCGQTEWVANSADLDHWHWSETRVFEPAQAKLDGDADIWLDGEHVTLRQDNVDDWIEWE